MHVVLSGDHSAECVDAVHADHSYVCLPLLAHGEAIGILHFQMIEPGEVPQPVLLMVTMFTEQVGLSVANIRLREALRNNRSADRSVQPTLSGRNAAT
jgi:GAF domain-containing protein